jgi:hypothetical protein
VGVGISETENAVHLAVVQKMRNARPAALFLHVLIPVGGTGGSSIVFGGGTGTAPTMAFLSRKRHTTE